MRGVFQSWPRRSRDPSQSKPSGPIQRRLIGIGHSHLQALQDAYASRETADMAARPVACFVQMLSPEYSPTLLPDGRLNPALRARVNAALQEDEAPSLLFDCISGNEYHFIGLVNHPRPFDFVLPSRPDLPLQRNAEIISAALMRQSLLAQMTPALSMMKALRAALDVPIWHVQSPPPLPSDDHIRRHPTHFAEQIAEHGVAPASFRMKLWLLQSEIYRAQCDELGIGFVPVPEAACNADGFLLEAGWVPDPTHASIWYGTLVMQQIDALASEMQRNQAA